MNKEQMELMLKKLRWLNIETIKAQEAGDKAKEDKLETHFNGVAFALVALGHRDFYETFMECECGHNFGLTGTETLQELEEHYKEMDNYYDLLREREPDVTRP